MKKSKFQATLISVIAALDMAMVAAVSCAAPPQQPHSADANHSRPPVQLSKEHIAAVNRPRRIFPNADESMPLDWQGDTIKDLLDTRFALFDEPGSQVDGVVWNFDEGNLAWYPSKVLPMIESAGLKKWLDAGIDFVKVMVDETHKRKMEVFWAYRVNGYDVGLDRKPLNLPMKAQHPDWVLDDWKKPWNFSIPGVRDYKVAILRELAENYDFDGIDLDFTRHAPHLPVGQAWLHRDAMTDFIRRVRETFQEVAQKRGRPLLLSVRVAENLPGCHYDGLDIETWARENLVDIIFMGGRSLDVDMAGFRRAIEGRNIKLIPSYDDYHTSDGYEYHPPIEFFRGMYGNWWHQGADAVQSYNFHHVKPGQMHFVPSQQQAYHDIGDPQGMHFKDKQFVVQRRYGLYGATGEMYILRNPHGQLPAALGTDGLPSLQSLYVCDDVAAADDRLKDVELRVLLSGTEDKNAVEVKLNGVRLVDPTVRGGEELKAHIATPKPTVLLWNIFKPPAKAFAVGSNLVSVRLRAASPPSANPVAVEKLEVHVGYKQ